MIEKTLSHKNDKQQTMRPSGLLGTEELKQLLLIKLDKFQIIITNKE